MEQIKLTKDQEELIKRTWRNAEYYYRNGLDYQDTSVCLAFDLTDNLHFGIMVDNDDEDNPGVASWVDVWDDESGAYYEYIIGE